LESFTDEFFSTQMETLRIPGGRFALVQNGEIVLAKGYGYADLETGSPISAEATVMRIGSVSKLAENPHPFENPSFRIDNTLGSFGLTLVFLCGTTAFGQERLHLPLLPLAA
jgi:hypothetical protein